MVVLVAEFASRFGSRETGLLWIPHSGEFRTEPFGEEPELWQVRLRVKTNLTVQSIHSMKQSDHAVFYLPQSIKSYEYRFLCSASNFKTYTFPQFVGRVLHHSRRDIRNFFRFLTSNLNRVGDNGLPCLHGNGPCALRDANLFPLHIPLYPSLANRSTNPYGAAVGDACFRVYSQAHPRRRD